MSNFTARHFITLYAKNKWSIGYWPHYSGMRDYEHIEIRNDFANYSGKIVREGSPQIPQEVKEAYWFWCGMLEE